MAEIPLDDDDGSGSDSAAMMAAMGFAGFGMQRPAKKRKYDEQHHHDHDGVIVDAASGTGANTAPLGARRGASGPAPASGSLPARPGRKKKMATGAAGSRDADEIELDDDDDDGRQDAGADGAADVENGAAEGAPAGEAGAGPQYIDTSRPSRGYLPEELEDMAMQAKIDAIMSATLGPQGGYPNQQQPQHHHHRQQQQQPPRHRPTHQQGGGGRPWWVGYYDAKTNENPWEKLERERGLQPRGAWLERGAAAPGSSRAADHARAAAAAAGGGGGAAAAAAAAGSAPGEAGEAVREIEEGGVAADAGGCAPAG